MTCRFSTALLVLAVITSRVGAQDPTPGVDLPTDGRSPLRNPRQRFVAIPTLQSVPATGLGAGLGLAMLYPSDSAVYPSMIAVGGIYATSNSWAYGAGGRAVLAHDFSRNLAGVADYRLRYDFYGVGTPAGDADHPVKIVQRGDAEVAEVTIRALPKFYVGPRYRRAHFTVHLDEDNSTSELAPLVAQEDLYLTSALGAMFLYDTRDYEVATYRGTWVRGDAMFANKGLGGLQTFNDFDLAANQYVPLSAHSVLALRAKLCDVTSGAPVWEYCLFGLDSDLRGYLAGRYRDRALGAAQAEYRFPIWQRFGGVAFAGAGEVAPDFNKLNWNDMLASGGAGLRYLIPGFARLNAGAEYAVGKNGGAFYLRLGEAF